MSKILRLWFDKLTISSEIEVPKETSDLPPPKAGGELPAQNNLLYVFRENRSNYIEKCAASQEDDRKSISFMRRTRCQIEFILR